MSRLIWSIYIYSFIIYIPKQELIFFNFCYLSNPYFS